KTESKGPIGTQGPVIPVVVIHYPIPVEIGKGTVYRIPRGIVQLPEDPSGIGLMAHGLIGNVHPGPGWNSGFAGRDSADVLQMGPFGATVGGVPVEVQLHIVPAKGPNVE